MDSQSIFNFAIQKNNAVFDKSGTGIHFELVLRIRKMSSFHKV